MFKSSNKVKFEDQQLDDYVLENSVLKSKLQSKIDALSIMSRELDKCSMERDKYQVLVEQLKQKRTLPLYTQELNGCMYKFTPTNTISGGEILAKTRDQNYLLKLEIESLRNRLEDAQGDIIALRKQLNKQDLSINDNSFFQTNSIKSNGSLSHLRNDYEQLVQELEKYKNKYQQIQLDYRAILDEKDELISDRDYYKNKVQRLNHQISYILTTRVKPQSDESADPPTPIVDIDALVTENKYLHERITQLQVEKEIIKRTLTKYKTLLENRHKTDSLNFKRGFADVMTQKQVREFLDINSKTGLNRGSSKELKSLCLGLFEAVNDKAVALQHQRKTNQILANRIAELEKTLESWCNGQKYIPIFPSQMLLDEILPDPTGRSDELTECSDRQERTDKENDRSSIIGNMDNSDSGSSGDLRSYGDNYPMKENGITTKTVLPAELEELVKEALAELRPQQ